ncbi:hypothetical protein AAVH_20680 [Aphelenchoides avenae]|nr:hypothetical protein AAVH_20680 [Aphelenchus avenae]
MSKLSVSRCNGGEISINYTHPYDTKCEKGQYITEMASLVVDAMRCGAPCKQPPCIYDKTDACAGLHYNDLLCALSTCNHDAGHNLRNDGGADHNRDAEHVHNVGKDCDFFGHTHNYGCSSDLDNLPVDYRNRSFNSSHRVGVYHEQAYDD